jgi:hypothetical protein
MLWAFVVVVEAAIIYYLTNMFAVVVMTPLLFM